MAPLVGSQLVLVTTTTTAATSAVLLGRLLVKGIQEGICGRILCPVGAQSVVVVAAVGEGSRAARGAAACIEVVAVRGARHGAHATAAGCARPGARVVGGAARRGAAKESCPRRRAAVLGQGSIQMHGIVVAIAVGGGEGTGIGSRMIVAAVAIAQAAAAEERAAIAPVLGSGSRTRARARTPAHSRLTATAARVPGVVGVGCAAGAGPYVGLGLRLRGRGRGQAVKQAPASGHQRGRGRAAGHLAAGDSRGRRKLLAVRTRIRVRRAGGVLANGSSCGSRLGRGTRRTGRHQLVGALGQSVASARRRGESGDLIGVNCTRGSRFRYLDISWLVVMACDCASRAFVEADDL